MTLIVLVIHLLIAVALIGVVLIQKSEGGGLGMGGGGMGGFMTGRSAANLLTRSTAILAGIFFLTSIVLALLAAQQRTKSSIVVEPVPAATESPAPASAPTANLPVTVPSDIKVPDAKTPETKAPEAPVETKAPEIPAETKAPEAPAAAAPSASAPAPAAVAPEAPSKPAKPAKAKKKADAAKGDTPAKP